MMLPATASMTVMLLTVAYYALRRQTDHNYFVNVPIPVNGSYFDFIIVGGGTAGCILAHRLSTRLNASILMLEAGGPQSVITDMIGNTQYLIGGEFDWNYHVQQQHYAGLAYPNFTISRGLSYCVCELNIGYRCNVFCFILQAKFLVVRQQLNGASIIAAIRMIMVIGHSVMV